MKYDLEGVCQDCIYLEKIRPLFEEKDKKIETLEKGLEYAKRIEKDYKTKVDRAIEYMKYNATSNYFDIEKNMFRREIDLLRILGGSDKE